MANGEALTKRYEVYDAETGERVEGPLYVLRPNEDELAKTAMFCYCDLAGLDDDELRRSFAMPEPNSGVHSDDSKEREAWRKLIAERMDVPEGTLSQSGEQFVGMASQGLGADGSMAYATTLMETFGCELAFVAFRRSNDKERVTKAKERRYDYQDAELRRRWREEGFLSAEEEAEVKYGKR